MVDLMKIDKGLSYGISIFLILIYVAFAVGSELTGDYLVYWDMYLNGSVDSFDNQPIFTAYFEAMRRLLPSPEIFFFLVLSSWLVWLTHIYIVAPLSVMPILTLGMLLFFSATVLQPVMLIFLLRQNISILALLCFLPYNKSLAFIISIGIHYSLIPIIAIAGILNYLFKKTESVRIRTLSYLIISISLLTISTDLSMIFSVLPTFDQDIIDRYISLYQSYDDSFPDFVPLRLWIIAGSLVYVMLFNRLNNLCRWVGALTASIFIISCALSFSDPLSYRFLQAGKIPSLLMIVWFLAYRFNSFRISPKKYEFLQN